MSLMEKSELNKPQALLTSGKSCRKAEQNISSVYLQSLVEKMKRIFEVVKKDHFDKEFLRFFFFVFFSLICI